MRVKDRFKFDDWMHMIFNPMVVTIYNGETIAEKELTKSHIIPQLWVCHGLLLTSNWDILALSKNDLNIPVKAMV